MAFDLEQLNSDCVCLTLDRRALADRLQLDSDGAEVAELIARERPTLLSDHPLFLAGRRAAAMAEIIAVIERTIALPAFRQTVLSDAPEIARNEHGPVGIFMGYDFHLGSSGPRLIEINTNAGGALINAYLAEAQHACCDAIGRLVPPPDPLATLTQRFVSAFGEEWKRFGAPRRLARIAIVDRTPSEQYLFPEFVLFKRLFERAGIDAVIADPADLRFAEGRLQFDGAAIDLVYNRLTDFYFESADLGPLREAYLANAVAVTPNPHAHALYADKRNLALLTDSDRLAAIGVGAADIAVLAAGIARTREVAGSAATELWQQRSRLFFKPARGYGSRAAFRGDKITRKAFAEVMAGDYVSQELVPPSQRAVVVDGIERQMKVDVRNYTYGGEVLLLAARLYEGQTTNFRTKGGGFAPVFTERAGRDPVACHCHDQAASMVAD